MSLLLQYDAKGKVRLPPLHIAAKKDDVQSAMLLLNQAEQRGQNGLPYAPVDQPSKSGFSALHIGLYSLLFKKKKSFQFILIDISFYAASHYGNERMLF